MKKSRNLMCDFSIIYTKVAELIYVAISNQLQALTHLLHTYVCYSTTLLKYIVTCKTNAVHSMSLCKCMYVRSLVINTLFIYGHMITYNSGQ